MSKAGEKSFFSSVPYDNKTKAILLNKSVQIYPLIEEKSIAAKKLSESLRLLFAGMFYIKGGMELASAFEHLRKTYSNLTLTIITPTHTIKEADQQYLRSIPGLTLLDAAYNDDQMSEFYRNHDIFILPTYRDGFGLVLVEAISWGLPIICTDQYATTEVAIDGYNAFIYPNHPLKDYDTKSFTLLGKYYNPKDFYRDLFHYQKDGSLKPVIDFLTISIERFLKEPSLLESYSKNSLALYREKFGAQKISDQVETVFLDAVSEK
ncbi:MAG: glycosyltransferase family 4 protein [Undibacterium sp.]